METWHCPLILFFAFLIKLLHESLKSMRNFIFCGIFFLIFTNELFVSMLYIQPLFGLRRKRKSILYLYLLRLQTV
jgi:hypothetical protein